jgi:NADH:ubiquinone oxidoreductase subunit 3 (subunit A)
MEKIDVQNKKIGIMEVFKTLFVIGIIMVATFLGISFISQAPELTNRFFIYVMIFIVTTVSVAVLIHWVALSFSKKIK